MLTHWALAMHSTKMLLCVVWGIPFCTNRKAWLLWCHHLTHRGRVTHICVGNLTLIGSNQYWNIVNWNLINKLHWNLYQSWNIFIQENALENVVCPMVSLCLGFNVLMYPIMVWCYSHSQNFWNVLICLHLFTIVTSSRMHGTGCSGEDRVDFKVVISINSGNKSLQIRCNLHVFIVLTIMTMADSLQWRPNEHDGISNNQPCDCLFNRLFRHRWKKTSKLRITGLCAGNSRVTNEFPQRASDVENVSIWWCHHVEIDHGLAPRVMIAHDTTWGHRPHTCSHGPHSCMVVWSTMPPATKPWSFLYRWYPAKRALPAMLTHGR